MVKYVLKTSAPKRLPFDLTKDLNPEQRAVVEAGPRKPLPFVAEATVRSGFLADAGKLRELLPANPSENEIFTLGRDWMQHSGAGATTLAGFARRRAAPPLG